MSVRYPVLSPEFVAALRRVGTKLGQHRDVTNAYLEIPDSLNAIPATLLARAEREIVEAAGLYRASGQAPAIVRLFATAASPTGREQLHRVPELEFLFLFHRDGHVREAALRKIAVPIPSAFLFAALASRLNDWVPQVRAAAAECARRTFAITSPAVIAEAATVLLPRNSTWGRWAAERDLMDEAFARSDVTQNIADILTRRTTGPSAAILRQALRSAPMDSHLATLARDSIQPAVRAVAAQALIDGFASWASGWRWRWIDKSMGVRKAEAVFERRELSVLVDRTSQIEAALSDRSAVVRNAAIAGLIRYRDEIPNVRALAEPLLQDRSRRVRERARFLLQ